MQTAETIDPFMNALLIKISEQSKKQGHSLEFVEGAADWVIRQTKAQLTGKERAQFMASLSMYPKWKLLELDEFRGYFSDVLRYLNNLQPKPSDPYSELGYDRERRLLTAEPESKVEQRIQLARDFNDHVQKWCGDIGNRRLLTADEIKEKRKGEFESYKNLDKKYPHLNIMAQTKSEKRFKDL